MALLLFSSQSIPEIHLFNAWFKEQTGDVFGAHAAFVQHNTESDSSFIENVIKEANMEKRLVCEQSFFQRKRKIYSDKKGGNGLSIAQICSKSLCLQLLLQHCQGNFAAASNVFKEALATAAQKQKFHILTTLYIYFSRLEYMVQL